jgi:hypothetical protein
MDRITDYATLQSAVAGLIHRSADPSITANVPLFIQLCEAELSDRLILKDMESDESLTLTTGNNYVALPSGFISPIKFWLLVDSVRVWLDFVLPKDLPYWSTNGQPRFVAVDAANLRFDSPSDQNYTAYLRCVKSSALSDSSPTNALVVSRPNVYLYGTLKQVALFTKDDADLTKYGNLFEASIQRAKAADNRNRGIVTLTSDVPSGRGRSNILIGEP